MFMSPSSVHPYYPVAAEAGLTVLLMCGCSDKLAFTNCLVSVQCRVVLKQYSQTLIKIHLIHILINYAMYILALSLSTLLCFTPTHDIYIVDNVPFRWLTFNFQSHKIKLNSQWYPRHIGNNTLNGLIQAINSHLTCWWLLAVPVPALWVGRRLFMFHSISHSINFAKRGHMTWWPWTWIFKVK